ncbi:hypothetical protein QTO34_000422 [Cnephaeus nilssonii]|uniref:Uncharacterized protein n=1 Tax=Cnephaeus nilssonii TaxID=3371016 RepID=A0AA40ICF9_CNENI|nr:hypothetical protein QTO34_000422 [Eptesicus nilssonii]
MCPWIWVRLDPGSGGSRAHLGPGPRHRQALDGSCPATQGRPEVQASLEWQLPSNLGLPEAQHPISGEGYRKKVLDTSNSNQEGRIRGLAREMDHPVHQGHPENLTLKAVLLILICLWPVTARNPHLRANYTWELTRTVDGTVIGHTTAPGSPSIEADL